MSDQLGSDFKMPDAEAFSRNMAKIAEKSQRLVAQFLERQAAQGGAGAEDPLNLGRAFLEMTARMMSDPARLMEAQMSLWQDYLKLWQSTAQSMMGGERTPLIEPDTGDRRFKHPDWSENQVFDFIKQSYLLTARWLQSSVENLEGLDDKTARKVEFYTWCAASTTCSRTWSEARASSGSR
jgi:polyhydroxyalkanoate synthase